MFLSLLSGQMLQSPACSRTCPVWFCFLNMHPDNWEYFGDCFFLGHLFHVFLQLNRVCISAQSAAGSLVSLQMRLLQLHLRWCSVTGSSGTALLSQAAARALSIPFCSTVPCAAVAALNPAREQLQQGSCFAPRCGCVSRP